MAGLDVALAAALCPPFSAWPDPYRPFLSEDAGRPAAAHFRVGPEDRRPDESRFARVYGTSPWQLGTLAGRSVYRFSGVSPRAYLWAEANADYSAVDVWEVKEANHRIPPLSTPVDRVLCMGVLAYRQAFVVHSCGWKCNGKLLLFPGVSRAGKTTICRQLMQSGQGQVLSDDRMILRAEPAGFRAYGSPWPGDARQALQDSAPLTALCFLAKTPEHSLTPISPAEALRRLLEVASVPWYAPDLRDQVLPLLEQLVAAVPAYRLGFRPDPSVVDVILPLVPAASSQNG